MEVIHLLLLGPLPALGREKELISSCGLENAGLNILIICLLHRKHGATVIVMVWFLASKPLQYIRIFSSLCSILKYVSHRAVQNAKKSSGKQFWNLDEIHIHRNWTFPAVFLFLPIYFYRTAEYIIKGKDFSCLSASLIGIPDMSYTSK